MKIAIIGNETFQPIYMVQNYVSLVQLIYRPFNFYDPDYDEEITFLSCAENGIDSVALVRAGLEGFKVDIITDEQEPDLKKRRELLIDMSDKVVFFWDGKDAEICESLDYALNGKVNLEIYYPKTGEVNNE